MQVTSTRRRSLVVFWTTLAILICVGDEFVRENKMMSSVMSKLAIAYPQQQVTTTMRTTTQSNWTIETSDELYNNNNETTTNTTMFPTVYYTCGYPVSDIVFNIYPELRELPAVRFHKSMISNTSSRDFVLYGLGGRCMGWGKRKLGPEWFRQHFDGTFIIVNGEYFAPSSWERGFQLGYAPDDGISQKRVYFCSMTFVRYPPDVRNLIVDPMRKPRSTRRHFLIYTASNCVDFRQTAFHNLSLIDSVHHGGRCSGLNDTISRQARHRKGVSWHYNYQSYRQYRFCLVMENTKLEGYVTEKILMAFLGGCIPIYYGTSDVFLMFNPKAFVYYDIDDPSPALELVKLLNRNQTAYDKVMSEPILANGSQTIEDYFSLADDIGSGKLKNQIRAMIDRGRSKYVV